MRFGIALLLIFGGLWCVGLFFGYMRGITAHFSQSTSVVDSSALKEHMQTSIDDIKEKQRKMLEDIQQKIADHKKI